MERSEPAAHSSLRYGGSRVAPPARRREPSDAEDTRPWHRKQQNPGGGVSRGARRSGRVSHSLCGGGRGPRAGALHGAGGMRLNAGHDPWPDATGRSHSRRRASAPRRRTPGRRPWPSTPPRWQGPRRARPRPVQFVGHSVRRQGGAMASGAAPERVNAALERGRDLAGGRTRPIRIAGGLARAPSAIRSGCRHCRRRTRRPGSTGPDQPLRGPDRDLELEAAMCRLETLTLGLSSPWTGRLPETGRHYKELTPATAPRTVTTLATRSAAERPEPFVEDPRRPRPRYRLPDEPDRDRAARGISPLPSGRGWGALSQWERVNYYRNILPSGEAHQDLADGFGTHRTALALLGPGVDVAHAPASERVRLEKSPSPRPRVELVATTSRRLAYCPESFPQPQLRVVVGADLAGVSGRLPATSGRSRRADRRAPT